jgi:hypothetical protein
MRATLIPVGCNELLGCAIDVSIQLAIDLPVIRSMTFNSIVL